MKKSLLTILAVLLAFAAPALSLDIGDKALPISAESWVTGAEVDPTAADGKTIYLVEVWSVTCPPCVQTIPILNDLQKRYADQGFKIVSFTSDSLEEVEPFLEEHPMEYSSFIDKDGETTINYMAADNRNTIPHAFMFDKDGNLIWEGNPLDNLEERLKSVLNGEYTLDKAVAIRDARENLQDAFSGQDVSGMIKALEELERLEPDNGQYYQVHYRILTEIGYGDHESVQKLMNDWYEGCKDRVDALMVLSVLAIDQGPPAYRNPELALAAAKRAYSLDSSSKIEAGLNLAETYKSIGRVDLSLQLVQILAKDAPAERIEIMTSIENFYHRLVELGKNPDAEYKP